MWHLDAVGHWIALVIGRSLDEHAAHPIPAAAHLSDAGIYRGPAGRGLPILRFVADEYTTSAH
ncbi:hypothetical protein [Micromonospora sp. NPDC000018]|uniref:hypothetical protein n=1 Tax=Micromonospora sp. NPDC000018 TaxID=3154239 RepID=UPI00332EAFE6